MKRYLLFVYDDFYPRGGPDDMVGDFDELAECRPVVDANVGRYAKALDTQTGQVHDFEDSPPCATHTPAVVLDPKGSLFRTLEHREVVAMMGFPPDYDPVQPRNYDQRSPAVTPAAVARLFRKPLLPLSPHTVRRISDGLDRFAEQQGIDPAHLANFAGSATGTGVHGMTVLDGGEATTPSAHSANDFPPKRTVITWTKATGKRPPLMVTDHFLGAGGGRWSEDDES